MSACVWVFVCACVGVRVVACVVHVCVYVRVLSRVGGCGFVWICVSACV